MGCCECQLGGACTPHVMQAADQLRAGSFPSAPGSSSQRHNSN